MQCVTQLPRRGLQGVSHSIEDEPGIGQPIGEPADRHTQVGGIPVSQRRRGVVEDRLDGPSRRGYPNAGDGSALGMKANLESIRIFEQQGRRGGGGC